MISDDSLYEVTDWLRQNGRASLADQVLDAFKPGKEGRTDEKYSGDSGVPEEAARGRMEERSPPSVAPKWSSDLSTVTPAAHVRVTYFDQEAGEWVEDIVASWDIATYIRTEPWTHWKDLGPNPDQERKSSEAVSDEFVAIPKPSAEGG